MNRIIFTNRRNVSSSVMLSLRNLWACIAATLEKILSGADFFVGAAVGCVIALALALSL